MRWTAYAVSASIVIAGFVSSLGFTPVDCIDYEPCGHHRWGALIGSVFAALVILYLARMFRRD